MLVITRRLNEAVLVGEDVRIVILGIDGDRIKIGIEAPAALKILRGELLAEIRDANRAAIVTDLAALQSLLHPAEIVLHPAEIVAPAAELEAIGADRLAPGGIEKNIGNVPENPQVPAEMNEILGESSQQGHRTARPGRQGQTASGAGTDA